MPLNGQDLADEARKWLGVRWHHQGRNIAGIDCAGLIVMVTADLGIDHEDAVGYARTPEGQKFRDLIRSQTTPENVPEPGMIGIFREGLLPCHVAFFAKRDDHVSIIHAYAGAHKVVEELFTDDWRARLIEVRGILGVDYMREENDG